MEQQCQNEGDRLLYGAREIALALFGADDPRTVRRTTWMLESKQIPSTKLAPGKRARYVTTLATVRELIAKAGSGEAA